MLVCHYCRQPAAGRCRDCRQLYCPDHGRILCWRCRRAHRLPMVALAAVGTFPTAACALVAIAYQVLRLDLFGPAGAAVLVLAAAATAGAAAVVWRHPEGIAHAGPDAAAELAAGRAIEEHVAANIAFDQRGPPLRQAVDHYLAAADASPEGSTIWLDANFAAGALLAGENSVRDLDRAVPLLEAVIEKSLGYHPAYYYLGEALVMRADYDRAEEIWRRGLALDPTQRAIADVLAKLPLDRRHKPRRRRD